MAGADWDQLGAPAAWLAPLLSAVLVGLLADMAAAQVETPPEVLAVQARAQGHACDTPIRAEKDETASQPNRAVWRLECGNASYRIVLHPDRAAEIEPIE